VKVLQISVHFHPNVGGVETHLIDLVTGLAKRRWKVTVLSYCPLTTNVKWKLYERISNVEIIRIPWLSNLFYSFIDYPLFEFLYLFPGLFLICPFIIARKKPDIIHAHGLVAGFVGVFWGKIFGKKIIISTHNYYNFPKKGLYKEFAGWIFSNTHKTLGLSDKSVNEIRSLGVSKHKVGRFVYWIDLRLFKTIVNAKKKLGFKEKLVVLFIGRLVREKGIEILLQSFRNWSRNIKLVIAGSGPQYMPVKQLSREFNNLEVLGNINQKKLPAYYSGADLTIMPSNSEEGFGRVILESLACGTPVIGADRGSIPEAMDETVGKFIKVTPQNIKDTVEYFLNHKSKLKKLSLNCRKFAERRYDEKNVEDIIKAYTS
jgi:glycosyltransferase involved in cell wall biosynthesis